MTRQERLAFCKSCNNRQFSTQKGLICSLTSEIAAFEGTCADYVLDERMKSLENFRKEQVVKVKKVKRKQTEKITLDDLFLLAGMGFITTFFIRLHYYMRFSYSDTHSGFVVIGIVMLTAVVAVFFRKKRKYGMTFWSDIKFHLLFAAFVAVLNLFYISLFIPGSTRELMQAVIFFVIALVISILSKGIVLPLQYLQKKIH